METRILGARGLRVPGIGLGCWGMSDAYGNADRAEAIATIHQALAAGVNFFDTADIYGAGGNEILLGEALRGRRAEALIATKFGFRGREQGALEICGAASYVREACHASLHRLKTDYLDLYYQHRVDQKVPIEETVSALAELVQEGKVRHLGLSEASAETLQRAHAIHPITALQSEYSLLTRGVEEGILPVCRKLKIGFVAFSPLGRGLLGGGLRGRHDLGPDDYRRNLPRFEAGLMENNLALARKVETIALRKKARPTQIALAWLLQQGDDIVPIPGMKSRRHLEENSQAAGLHLSPGESESLRQLAGAVQGARHNAENLRFLDKSGGPSRHGPSAG
jgi:aryl-alcohol dehydrogenase-like predicted oxidoreductase